jgi:hypothetical protein
LLWPSTASREPHPPCPRIRCCRCLFQPSDARRSQLRLTADAERRLRLADPLAAAIHDPRHPQRMTHAMADILRARIVAIACGYEDANDLNRLRTDPAFNLACGRLPDRGLDLCSQPTCLRLENLPDLRTVIRLGPVLVDLWLSSYAAPPKSVTLDIDDMLDVVHRHQQLLLFTAHCDERCFLLIHIYDAATGRPVAMILRPGKTPTGKEIRGHLRHLVRRIRVRVRWPTTHILIRGESHCGREQVMAWCENNAIDNLFGLPGNKVLQRLVDEAADDIRTRRARAQAARLCRDPIQGEIVEDGTPRLRPRPGRKPDQDAQEPARLRPHLLPLTDSQPGPSRPAHRRILVDAHPARGGAHDPSSAQRRVRDAAARAAQARRPRHRNRLAHPPGLRRRLSRGKKPDIIEFLST